MQITSKKLSDTSVELVVVADAELLKKAKELVLKKFAKELKLAGFRKGKAPLNLVEKNIDEGSLQNEFISEAVNRMYFEASEKEKLRAATQPKVDIKKFVPYDTLEITVTSDVIGDVKLADYKNVKASKKEIKITAKDVTAVLENLATREAEKKEVERASKKGDELLIDFVGTDTKSGEAISGADGKDYPLVLGSEQFIPGFEEELLGLKPGSKVKFDITFPKDYSATALQNKKATFAVTVKQVTELVKPKIDDEFAAKVGPFKNLDELKEDIKKQLSAEQDNQAQRAFENEILEELLKNTTVAIPTSLVDEQLDGIENDERQNAIYRGQTWEEHLAAEGVNEAEHREKNRPRAEERVKAGIILSEIAELEKITVSPDELEIRMQLLKGQYPDPQMQAELDKPEGRRSVLSRMVTEKTMAKLAGYAKPAKK